MHPLNMVPPCVNAPLRDHDLLLPRKDVDEVLGQPAVLVQRVRTSAIRAQEEIPDVPTIEMRLNENCRNAKNISKNIGFGISATCF